MKDLPIHAPEKVKHKRSTLGDEDLELDYLDDVIGDDDVIGEEDDKLLYGDLDFDDEQTNAEKKPSEDASPKTTTTKNESDGGGEENGEVPDCELFATTVGENPSSPTNKDIEENEDLATTTMDDDTEIDDAIDNAMNIEGLLGGGSEVTDSDSALQTPVANDDETTANEDAESSTVDDESNR